MPRPDHYPDITDRYGDEFLELLRMTNRYNRIAEDNPARATMYWENHVQTRFDRRGYQPQQFEALSWMVDCYIQDYEQPMVTSEERNS